MEQENRLCRLCTGSTLLFHRDGQREFYRCTTCEAVMLDEALLPDPDYEEDRYRQHNNDVEDPRYQNFVNPITSAVQKDFSAGATGLDYGCGPGPVAAVLLGGAGYPVTLYDPFFENHPQALEQTYDFIICCEVMEHFHYPAGQFELLFRLLNPGGKLYCKTSLLPREIPFADWYYKNDPTHVFFYTFETLEWIKDHVGFNDLKIEPKLITFSR